MDYDDDHLHESFNPEAPREILETLEYTAPELEDDFREIYSSYFGGGCSRWHAVFQAVRCGAFSPELDELLSQAQTVYRQQAVEQGLSTARWSYGSGAKNNLKSRLAKVEIARALLPWFTPVEQDIFDVMESDASARARVVELLDGLSVEAGYEYFNHWRFMGELSPMSMMGGQDVPSELLAHGLFHDSSRIPLMNYFRWIDFKELKAKLQTFGIAPKSGYDKYLILLESGEHEEARSWVETTLREVTAGNECFVVPEPEGFTKNDLMDLRVRAQTLMSIVELVERRQLPKSLFGL